MTYEIYRYIFIGGAVLSGIMLAVSVLVFFLLKIPNVIGDLSGANARRAIADIRSHNEKTGDKVYRTSRVNRERGKITDRISPSGKLKQAAQSTTRGAMATEKISAAKETEVLQTAPETSVLTGNETTILSGNETSLPVENETTVLRAPVPGEFVIEYEITLIHTDEVVPTEG